MDILTFDIKGKFAHFRKYYSNSTALSYFIPPRTTVAGIIAAILGYDRDSYYDKFSLDNCNIGIKVNNKIKKSNQCVNYLSVKSAAHLNGSNGRTQIPFEIVMPETLKDSFVSYKVFFNHSDPQIMETLYKNISSGEYNPVTLGTASFNAFIEDCKLFSNIEPSQINGNFINISSAMPLNKVKEFNFSDTPKKIMLQTETIPYQFNENRELTAHGEVLFTSDNTSISVKLKDISYYELDSEYMVFIK